MIFKNNYQNNFEKQSQRTFHMDEGYTFLYDREVTHQAKGQKRHPTFIHSQMSEKKFSIA